MSKLSRKAKPATALAAEERTTLDEEMAAPASRPLTSYQQKVLVVIVIDASGSMKVSRALLLAIKAAERMLREAYMDPMLKMSAEFAVVLYDGDVVTIRRLGPFQEGIVWDVELEPEQLCGGMTKTAKAVKAAFAMIEERSGELSEEGIPRRAAMVVVLTDGHATDSPADTEAAIARRKELEKRSDFRIFGVAVGDGVDMSKLRDLCGETLVLAGLDSFDALFNWIRVVSRIASMTRSGEAIGQSNPIAGDNNPTGFARPWCSS